MEARGRGAQPGGGSGRWRGVGRPGRAASGARGRRGLSRGRGSRPAPLPGHARRAPGPGASPASAAAFSRVDQVPGPTPTASRGCPGGSGRLLLPKPGLRPRLCNGRGSLTRSLPRPWRGGWTPHPTAWAARETLSDVGNLERTVRSVRVAARAGQLRL